MTQEFLIGTGLLALVLLLTMGLGVLGTVVWPEYKRKMTGENLQAIVEIIDKIMVAAVAYAEQTQHDNEAKKQAAIAYAERELRRYGIQMDLKSINDHIETAVYQYLNYLAQQWGSSAN